MINSQPVRTAVRRTRSPAAPSSSAVPTAGITIYGCEPDERAAFTELAPRFGIAPTITEAAPTEDNADLARGHRCISVGHKTKITDATLLALSRAGVQYISTRSVGCNHIDVAYADSLGITVGTVGYSPDSVADYTVMLILMAVRQAKSTIRRADVHDYRLNALRGRELRDLTVGVVGTGRIGAAVIDRLDGFGCTILAHDKRPKLPVDHVPLDQLLQLSDVVTLHTPLTRETHHLLDRQRIARLKRGMYLVNTGRGELVETEALTRALESGWLGGAALDVLEGEEGIYYADCSDKPIRNQALLRLQRLPSVIVSPHTAYYTDRALHDVVENTLANCLAFQADELTRKQHGHE